MMKAIGAALSVLTGAAAAAAGQAPSTAEILVRRDTQVHLMVVTEVSTKDRHPGDRFKLRVDQPVLSDGVIVIPAGTPAFGEVLQAHSSGNVGEAGSLSARLDEIVLGETHIPLTGDTQTRGRSGTGATVLGVLAVGVLGFFAKGNNAKLKAGDVMIGFVATDTLVPRPAPAAIPTG